MRHRCTYAYQSSRQSRYDEKPRHVSISFVLSVAKTGKPDGFPVSQFEDRTASVARSQNRDSGNLFEPGVVEVVTFSRHGPNYLWRSIPTQAWLRHLL
jgi:hypothetical protein